jgi:hypothetical protein
VGAIRLDLRLALLSLGRPPISGKRNLTASRGLDAECERHSADHRDRYENDTEKAIETPAPEMLLFLLFLFLNQLCSCHDRYLVPPAQEMVTRS